MTGRRLDIGSGYAPYGTWDVPVVWEHLDANRSCPHVEWEVDAFGPLPFDDATFVAVRAVDVWEHAPYSRSEEILREWVRVLAPGGTLYVQVPDAEAIMSAWVSSPSRYPPPPHLADEPAIVGAAWRLLGGHDDGRSVHDGDDWRLNAHYALFSEASVRTYLGRVGMVVDRVARNEHPNLLVDASKPAV